MKKLLGCIIAVFISIVAFTNLCALDEYKNNTTIREGSHRVFVSADCNHVIWKHGSYGKTKANPWFASLGYNFKQRDDIYLHFSTIWGGGKYKGHGSYNFQSFNHALAIEGKIGFMFGLGNEKEFGVTPYLGMACLSKRVAVAQPNSFHLKNHSIAIPIGVLCDWDVTPEFNVALNVQARFNSSNKWKVRDCSASSGLIPGIKEKVKNHVNWYFEIPMTYQLTNEWDICFVPSYFNGKETIKDAVNSIGTSSSVHKYSSWGARIELGFSF